MSPSTQTPPQFGTVDNETQHAQPSRVRRRNRQITSCLECRRRKLKCDKGSPCINCTKNSRLCVFIASGLNADARKKLAEVKEKMGILEKSLEEGVTKTTHLKHRRTSDMMTPNPLPGQQESHSDQEDDEDTKNVTQSGFAVEDASYYDNGTYNDDDIADLGIAMGRVRITERIGGLVRPRFSEELTIALRGLPEGENLNSNPPSAQNLHNWMAPSQSYIAPSSSFFFSPGVEKTSLMTFLPSKSLVDRLITHYWDAVHVIAMILHRPSFEKQYEKFWPHLSAGVEPRASFQAVIFAALLASIISIPKHQVFTLFGVDKQSLVDNFKHGTEAALARANFLRATKLETLQAFVMYLIPLCRNEVSHAHSALTGTAIRLAECMGLHRDPTGYSSSPIEVHVRRLVWYQICFLDLRTCEASGPRPQIRHDDYDTRFPLNIDDGDLERAENGEAGVNVTKDRKHFTDITITRMRFECYEMHRLLWRERPKLEQRLPNGERKVTLISLLSRVQSFQAAMETTYLPMLNKSLPLHVLASEIYGILSDRLFVLLLQKYTTSDRSKPSRLRQLTISSSVRIIERSMVIEQHPALSTWKWYVGALHQYHTALLLMNELNAGHNEPGAEARVWKCMDFAFDLSPEMSTREKTRYVLEDLIRKTSIYASMKGLRAPISMPHPGTSLRIRGEQKRQQEGKSDRNSRSEEGSAGISDVGNASNFIARHNLAAQTLHHSKQEPFNQGINFPGAVPNIDWGSIDLPGSAPDFQLSQPSSDSHSVNISAGVDQYNNRSNLGEMNYEGTTNRTASNSPMEVFNEIDWNDIENMFGGSDVGSGIIIPPFTFPQFSFDDLTWPLEEQ
ncbi:fungal-specific transcription factor domain-containing protein [Phaeosphaeriaceae sp. PMI808]|nr:fungal-specific transcription factor domain-containing protein [Phaeosphaeriaceae sp. PMI808]